MIPLSDIYDKDINFLLGSGASYGLFPTLRLGVQNDAARSWSLEDLATQFENSGDRRHIPLFMHYYTSCVWPAQVFNAESVKDDVGKHVLVNYQQFLETVLTTLQRRRALDRRCNLFTTNYDGCIPFVADDLLRRGSYDFVLNDGTRGFRTKLLEARNFNSFLCQTGIFDRHQSSVPQINLIHLHGSVYWRKTHGGIEVDYAEIGGAKSLLSQSALDALKPFSDALVDPASKLQDVPCPKLTDEELNEFWASYKAIPVVNPTKWKFHETVYEEHYYQMLRLLSYELEKPNAVLITFGFSFADEHILNLVKRSLSNPHLLVFVCCYDRTSYREMSEQFRQHNNVRCVALEDDAPMNFTAFNERVFSPQTTPTITVSSPGNTQENTITEPEKAKADSQEQLA